VDEHNSRVMRGSQSHAVLIRFNLRSAITRLAVDGFVAIDDECKLQAGYLIIDGVSTTVTDGKSIVCVEREDRLTFVGATDRTDTEDMRSCIAHADRVDSPEQLLAAVCTELEVYL
jgi:hypothetical protein